MTEFLVANEGGTRRSLLRHYEGSELQHIRHLREDIDPHIRRVENISKAARPGKSEYRFLGSVPRIMIDDWLRKQGKSWSDYATDKELKAKFLVWFRSDCQKLMADNYQERSLATNRTLFNRRGASILTDYRKETSSAQVKQV
jgi:hypothetical protein